MTKSITKMICCGLVFLIFITIVSCSESPSYITFVSREKPYYEKVAIACENLRVSTPPTLSDYRKIPPDKLQLPDILKELHPDFVAITNNRVFLAIGVKRGGRGAYGIAWEPSNLDTSVWKLTTYAENLERVLFIKETTATDGMMNITH